LQEGNWKLDAGRRIAGSKQDGTAKWLCSRSWRLAAQTDAGRRKENGRRLLGFFGQNIYYMYKMFLGYDPGHDPGGPDPISAPAWRLCPLELGAKDSSVAAPKPGRNTVAFVADFPYHHSE
jgi:hypothetical protein